MVNRIHNILNPLGDSASQKHIQILLVMRCICAIPPARLCQHLSFWYGLMWYVCHINIMDWISCFLAYVGAFTRLGRFPPCFVRFPKMTDVTKSLGPYSEALFHEQHCCRPAIPVKSNVMGKMCAYGECGFVMNDRLPATYDDAPDPVQPVGNGAISSKPVTKMSLLAPAFFFCYITVQMQQWFSAFLDFKYPSLDS